MTDTIQCPDLLRGSMILAYDRPNRWITEIQAVLEMVTHGGEKRSAFLSHECRAENVLGVKDPIPEKILFAPYECVILKGWDHATAFRSGAYAYPVNPFAKLHSFNTEFPYSIQTLCKPTPVRFYDFDDIYNALQKEQHSIKKLFMRVNWSLGEFDFHLYAPCRYINYRNPNHASKGPRYLQPISGYVIYYDLKKFYIAYVVISLMEGRVHRAEFCLRDTTHFFDLKQEGFGNACLRTLTQLPLIKKLFAVDEFSKNITVEANCQIFSFLETSS